MSLSIPSRSLLAAAVLGTAFSATADPTCTQEPESNWMGMDHAKEQVEAMGYKIKVFKKTDTGCYELYGYTSDGKRVEIYFDPTDMKKVKEEIDD
ncbi:PepSY domain-containing protein [Grimontia hollisae]|uniref:PepSY domain-containing protein n=1 Tax=Grimontia hollisae TaxID=673 RepID=UPI001302ED48|nr:PepSY domain-containing protein [Grimontia hollisae]MDF2185265.1 PepSY domain-containing protein [Grimontia hollisae]